LRSRINSTSRKKIDSGMASFAVTASGDGLADFHAKIDLGPLKLSPAGEVVVEAYRQSVHERFGFGTVANTVAREPTRLRELGTDVRFRIKVIEPGTGRLLARGDKIGAVDSESSGRKELLKVVVRDLGQEPWKTELHADDGQPVLVLNDHIPDALAKIKSDPMFQGLILPGALRQILLMIWLEESEESDDDTDDEERWLTGWLRYARQLTGEDKPDWSDESAVRRWIDDVCRAFSAQFNLLHRLNPEG